MQNFELQSKKTKIKQFYFIYNTGSGGRKTKQLEFLDLADIKLQVLETEVTIHFFSIQNIQSRAMGYEKIKNEMIKSQIDSSNPLPIITAGGDGTTMWVIEQMIQYKIDIESIVIIPLPCGTGNDFSMSLGWGGTVPKDLLGQDYNVLKQYVIRWMNAKQAYFDIWDIKLSTSQNGSILEVRKDENGVSKECLRDSDGQILTVFNKKMANYFSIGVDARIGYGFDKYRTQSQCCNKCCYCWEGFKKMFISTKKVKQVISYMEHYHSTFQATETLFKTRLSVDRDAEVVPGNPVTLVCLNINSYSAGTKDIWKNAKSPFRNKQYSDCTSSSDGMIEFVSFDSILGIGGEKILAGNATRLAQTSGPLLIQFRVGDELTTYFQVDGQYYSVLNPSVVEIEPCKELPNGKIRVLINL